MSKPARGPVLTGAHYLDGDHACAEGAIAAGCRFIAGYPITPSTEVAERLAERFPKIGGTFIQMEDELASIAGIACLCRASGRSFADAEAIILDPSGLPPIIAVLTRNEVLAQTPRCRTEESTSR